ncbi:hypothetical protein AVEN_165328-1 [Araneus ventricosus]|uniref:Uncharacterized protein n=1 Tax=Araneus ventricosus TaxID=182803 RepID=A0A4Y2AV11_ARAVE|nr:hypothetical protein AVEN_165328-1 [Araneus ventricosus]
MKTSYLCYLFNDKEFNVRANEFLPHHLCEPIYCKALSPRICHCNQVIIGKKRREHWTLQLKLKNSNQEKPLLLIFQADRTRRKQWFFGTRRDFLYVKKTVCGARG